MFRTAPKDIFFQEQLKRHSTGAKFGLTRGSKTKNLERPCAPLAVGVVYSPSKLWVCLGLAYAFFPHMSKVLDFLVDEEPFWRI